MGKYMAKLTFLWYDNFVKIQTPNSTISYCGLVIFVYSILESGLFVCYIWTCLVFVMVCLVSLYVVHFCYFVIPLSNIPYTTITKLQYDIVLLPLQMNGMTAITKITFQKSKYQRNSFNFPQSCCALIVPISF